MSSLEAFTRQTSLNTGDAGPEYPVLGMGSVGVAIAGTFTSGTIKIQGSNDGQTWTDLQILRSSIPVSDDEIIAVGNYVCSLVSYQVARLLLTSFVGQVVATASISTQIVLPVVEGGDIVVDGITINGVVDSALATDADGAVYGVTGSSGDVMRLAGAGTANQYHLVHTGSTYVSVSDSGIIYTSTTGTGNWTRRATSSSSTLLSVGWNGSLLVACGVSGAILTSTDGSSWTARTSGVATNLSSVTWDATNSQWVIVGSTQTVLTSPDGITWTSRTYGTVNSIRGVAAGASIIAAVGASGVIKTSPDGITWTSRTSGVATELYGVSYDSTNTQFVAVGASGVILTSPDGITWTARTSGVSTFLRGVTWGNSLYTAVGASGVILTSPTGVTWTSRTSGVSTELYSVTTASTPLFVAVGLVGVQLTSPDGITWTQVAQETWIASTPVGTGSLLAQNGDKTINGTVTFPTPIRESSILSAPAIATDAEGDHVAASTIGSGSTLALQSTTTATLTLSTASGASGGAVFVRTGNTVTVTIQGIQGVSTGTDGVLSGVPAGYIPANTQICSCNTVVNDGVNYMGLMVILSDGTILVYYAPISLVNGGTSVTNTFTASGTKGTTISTITYLLN